MVISNKNINKLIDQGRIKVQPRSEIKEASIKLHFSDNLVLKTKSFVLSETLEKITLSNGIIGLYDGYSKLSQKGVMTHLGIMLCDSDTDSQLKLEIFNASDQDVLINKGDRCGQLVLLLLK